VIAAEGINNDSEGNEQGSSMTRSARRRIRLTVVLGAVAIIGAAVFVEGNLHATWIPANPTDVVIVKTESSYPSDAVIQQMVRDAVALAGGLEGIVSPGDDVVIKPNCVETVWAKGGGQVTNCEVTREVVRLCQALGGYVKIAVGTARYRDGERSDRFCARKAFHDSGYDLNWDLVDDATGAGFIDLNDVGQTYYPEYPDYTGTYNTAYVTEINLTGYLLHQKYWIANDLANADVMISVPAIKNHNCAGVTMSLKNYVGIAPNDIYHAFGNQYKWSLVHKTAGTPYAEVELNARAIVDLNRCKSSDFTVVDALIGITDGPCGTDQASPRVRCVMAGQDPVAVDTIGTLVMGYRPSYVKSIDFAGQVGLGTNDLAKIRVIGEHVMDVRVDFPNGYAGMVRSDTVPPSIGGFTPTSGTVFGTVGLSPGGVGDNIGVVKAEMYVDGEPYGGTNVSPFNMDWDTTEFSDGDHDVTVYVYDNAMNEDSVTNTLSVDNYLWTGGAMTTGWNLVSVPLPPDDPEASAVFDDLVAAGNDLTNNLWKFDQGAGYSAYGAGWSDVELSRGYWLYLTAAATENLGGARLLDSVEIDLDDGWNLIGQPYKYAVAWSACTVSDGAETKTVQEAEDAGWIQATIYYYEGGGYKLTQPDGGDQPLLVGWRGYWLLANQPGLTLTVPRPY